MIDVREPNEVIQGMIPSAVNLPLSVLANSLHLHHAAFEEKHGFPKPKKEQEIVFYCRSGMRSSSACDVAKRNGYTKWVLIDIPYATTLMAIAAYSISKAHGWNG